MDAALVSNITRRSTPMPRPPVGGIPYSSAVRKSSSTSHASSSPAALSAACASKRWRWSIGSFSSENAFACSRPTIKSSKRSVYAGLSRHLLRQRGNLHRMVHQEGGLDELFLTHTRRRTGSGCRPSVWRCLIAGYDAPRPQPSPASSVGNRIEVHARILLDRIHHGQARKRLAQGRSPHRRR